MAPVAFTTATTCFQCQIFLFQWQGHCPGSIHMQHEEQLQWQTRVFYLVIFIRFKHCSGIKVVLYAASVAEVLISSDFLSRPCTWSRVLLWSDILIICLQFFCYLISHSAAVKVLLWAVVNLLYMSAVVFYMLWLKLRFWDFVDTQTPWPLHHPGICVFFFLSFIVTPPLSVSGFEDTVVLFE